MNAGKELKDNNKIERHLTLINIRNNDSDQEQFINAVVEWIGQCELDEQLRFLRSNYKKLAMDLNLKLYRSRQLSISCEDKYAWFMKLELLKVGGWA